jgi:hypothetical protein
MPLQLSDVFARTRTFTWQFQGLPLTVTYRIGKLTPAREARARVKGAKAIDLRIEELAEVVESWDLMDGEQLYPITKESIGKLPYDFIFALQDAITQDFLPNVIKPLPSGGGSLQKE